MLNKILPAPSQNGKRRKTPHANFYLISSSFPQAFHCSGARRLFYDPLFNARPYIPSITSTHHLYCVLLTILTADFYDALKSNNEYPHRYITCYFFPLLLFRQFSISSIWNFFCLQQYLATTAHRHTHGKRPIWTAAFQGNSRLSISETP